ncbi:MAG: arginine--tRNA ligase [Flavobacteriales bacterium]|nr:arginine--tRNA ligase [Flavobacteriales bacterium]
MKRSMNIENKIFELVKKSLTELYNIEIPDHQIQISKTKKDFDGDLTLVVFPLLRISKKGPEQTAEEIGNKIIEAEHSIVNTFNVVKGFLNLSINPSVWLDSFNDWLNTTQYGYAQEPSNKTLMVEYSSPNTNKPLHLGHLRNNFLGYAVAEILKANGHKVVKTQIINDRGIHICKSMLAWQLFGNGETPESSGLKGDHLIGKYYVAFDKAYKAEIQELVAGGMEEKEAEKSTKILAQAQEMLQKWEAGDAEVRALWEKMNGWVYDGFAITYKNMGVDFDSLYYESDTYLVGKEVVEEGLNKGVFYKKEDGSVWCDLSSEKMDDKLLLRGDGTSVYMTQDIGTALLRYKDNPSLSGLIYTVGNEQNHHFKVLFAILKKLGYKWAEECYHLSYGMVDLPSGRMKSREGTVVDADDLMESLKNDAKTATLERSQIEDLSEEQQETLFKTIGMGGLKYFLLKVDPKKKMLFNPEESIELNGNTGPFIQYTYARTQSILRTVGNFEKNIDTTIDLFSIEQELIKLIGEFPNVIKEAGDHYSPALIANYVYEIAKTYNSFYQSISIFKEEDAAKKQFRIALSYQVGEVIKNGMLLMGINVPERM